MKKGDAKDVMKIGLDPELSRRFKGYCLLKGITYCEFVTKAICREMGLDASMFRTTWPSDWRGKKGPYVSQYERRGEMKPGSVVERRCATCMESFWSPVCKDGTVRFRNCPAHRSPQQRAESGRAAICPSCKKPFTLAKGQPRTYGPLWKSKGQRRPAWCPACWAGLQSPVQDAGVVGRNGS